VYRKRWERGQGTERRVDLACVSPKKAKLIQYYKYIYILKFKSFWLGRGVESFSVARSDDEGKKTKNQKP
jgi:hypothetical protein